MKNMKSTKRSLFLSAMALLLCTSMLIGTTYAWFTESVTSVNNIITGGNLDVELEWWNATDKEWQSVTKDTNVFMEDTYWEPGHTEVVYLRVSNKGDLSLKYQLGVNVADEVHGTNVDGKDFLLSEKIYFDAIETATEVKYENRAEALAAVQVETQIKEGYSTASKLYPAATPAVAGQPSEEYVTLVVYMPETVGNEANHNGIQVPSITLGINLIATQFTWENDSFDEYYDAAAPWAGGIDTTWYDPAKTEYTINSAEALAGFAAIVNGTAEPDAVPYGATATTIQDTFEGKTVKLAADLDLKNIPWTPIGRFVDPAATTTFTHAFKGTFDGQGHTISNLKVTSLGWAGLFGIAYHATIKNVKVDGVELNSSRMVGSVVGQLYGSIDNCHVSNAKITVVPNEVSAGKYDNGDKVGGIVGWIGDNNNNRTLTNSSATDVTIKAYRDIGAIAGYVAWSTTISGCKVEKATLVSDQSVGYYGQKDANVNAIWGRNSESNTGVGVNAENNSFADVTTVTKKAVGTAEELKNALEAGGEWYLGKDIALNEQLPVKNGTEVTLNLNGKTITGTDTGTSSFGLITNKGNLTINGEGKITLTATTDRDWNAYSSVISNNPGGKLTVNGGTIEHLGGTDMAYGIDNLTNGKNTYAETVINGGTVKSTYRAIRMFLNGIEAQNILTVNGGIIEGANKSIWMQDPSKNANTGKLTVSADATLKGDAYLSVTAGSTAWPVEVSIATKALSANSTVLSSNVPAGCVVLNDGAKWYVKSGATVSNTITSGDIYLTQDTELPGTSGNTTISGTKDTEITVKGTPGGSNVTFNGVTVKGSGYATGVNAKTTTYNDVTIVGEMCLYGEKVVFNNCTFELAKGQYIWTYGAKNVEFNNCTFNTAGKAILVYNEGAGASKVTVKGCTFNATAGDKAGDIANQNCAAIEINNFQSSGTGVAHEVITEGNTYSSNFSGEWRIKKFVAGNAITVNGTAYEQIAVDGKLMDIDASKNVTVQG